MRLVKARPIADTDRRIRSARTRRRILGRHVARRNTPVDGQLSHHGRRREPTIVPAPMPPPSAPWPEAQATRKRCGSPTRALSMNEDVL